MITLHHLNNSRSQRILWLLEELKLDYKIETYQRDKETNLAPESLKLIHPLGKSPIITDGDTSIAESGAIIEYLISRYGEQSAELTKTTENTPSHWQYVYWLHFAEGTLMPPLVAKLVLDKTREKAKPWFVKIIANKIVDKIMAAYYGPIIKGNMQFIEQHLAKNEWFAGNELTGADVQMSFPLEAAVARGAATDLPNVKRFVTAIHGRAAYQKALVKGGQYDYA
ncbi:glutathione S-transferase [Paraglaciecola sp. 2405UD69-4]|uniref:glutathione S-transferase n=1 Tax=Paraglaciecola sp. 2405UD69-4 TaxID=3391836 RepID=UPI0039C94268